MANSRKAIHANILHCLSNPDEDGSEAIQYIENGTLLIENGHVVACGPADTIQVSDDFERHDLGAKLIVPGFVDTHIHYPQVDVIASYGTQLLDWLERYVFPEESTYSDSDVGQATASFFLDELLKNGTTTALVFGTVHPESVDAFFTQAAVRSLRMICGKVMMDRNAPENLLDTPESSLTDSQRLIDQWHEKERLGYAVTPRFAPTSSPEQLAMAQKLLNDNPTVHLHTHMAENADECNWVSELFPDAQDYLAVYEKFDLVRKRSVFAHSIHLSENAWARMAKADAAVAHCPCSNLFIGSGLFNLRDAQKHKVKVGLGTDVGGGDSFSLLRATNEAYKIQQLQKHTLTPEHAFYLTTLGGAKALDLDSHIGNFETGKEADFLVIDEHATPILSRRTHSQSHWKDRLFTLLMLGDDRCIEQTWIMGNRYLSEL
ncbi:guanine deaminase [Granulosicoccus sp.]|nr:guanine deaminase [Granulosicoccus sp.]MDB4222666.1 guanine deaminase [Granulosicoccus sp.]